MKSFDEMTYEEVLDIITVNILGNVLYLSKVSSLTENELRYDGETYKITKPEVFPTLTKALERYEVYKFLSTKESIDRILNTVLEERVAKAYQNTMEGIIEAYSSRMTEVLNKLDSDSHNISYLSSKLSSRIDSLGDTIDNLVKFLSEAVPTATAKRLDELTTSLDDLVDTYKRRYQTILSDFNEVTSNLKSLFTSAS